MILDNRKIRLNEIADTLKYFSDDKEVIAENENGEKWYRKVKRSLCRIFHSNLVRYTCKCAVC